jgi:hypothetical protein
MGEAAQEVEAVFTTQEQVKEAFHWYTHQKHVFHQWNRPCSELLLE